MDTWLLSYDEFVPALEKTREALTTTGNGYFCTRGSAEWADAGENHYPGTYMHGGYNRATSIIDGRPNSNEDLINLPNWLPLRLRIEGSDEFSLQNVEIVSYNHTFDIRCAVVERTVRFRDKQGRETTLKSRRFNSMWRMHMGAIEWQITAHNWSGKAEITSALDGRVSNGNVPVYRKFECRHLRPLRTEPVDADGISLLSRTIESHIYFAFAARTRVFKGDKELQVLRATHSQDDYIHQVLTVNIEKEETIRVEKTVAFYTSQDQAISEPLANAQIAVRRFDDFQTTYNRNENAWRQLWSRCDYRMPKSNEAQRLLRFNTCHVLMCCSPHTSDLDAAIPARGLTGEHYHGRIFWDEMYIYPFLNYRMPESTRGLLMYRYRRLDEARACARAAGYQGAMYPWQSGSDGREETHAFNYNWNDGKWYADLSHNQRHVNAAIFYNIWQYYIATRDVSYMMNHGAPMMIEIARFWESIAVFNPERGRYEIHGVMGPDEYHEKYPEAKENGIRNNAYTNVMAAWMFKTVLETLELFPEKRRKRLYESFDLTPVEIQKWQEMSTKMFIPFHDDGIITQFEGYEKLKELDWEHYRTKYKSTYRMDMILRAEGDSADRYKLAKQADTLMLFYLFSERELKELFTRLGYDYKADTMRKNIEYYYTRCSHCSTLSLIVHAAVMAGIDPERSWKMFVNALHADVLDVQGGTTQEGIHMGIMAGTLDLMQRGFMGMEIDGDGALRFKPKPIAALDGLVFRMIYRNTPLRVQLENATLSVSIEDGEGGQPTKVCVDDVCHMLNVGESFTFNLDYMKAAKSAA